jgi:aromatic-L-amino-acid/L-tryptophan decarboxylase
MVLGLAHARALPTSSSSDWSMRAADLEAAIARDRSEGLIPFYVCASVGTTSSCAVDPLPEIGQICARWGRAGAGAALCCVRACVRACVCVCVCV